MGWRRWTLISIASSHQWKWSWYHSLNPWNLQYSSWAFTLSRFTTLSSLLCAIRHNNVKVSIIKSYINITEKKLSSTIVPSFHAIFFFTITIPEKMGRGKDDNESGDKQNCKSQHGIDKSIHPPIPLQGWLCVILVHIMLILLIMKWD